MPRRFPLVAGLFVAAMLGLAACGGAGADPNAAPSTPAGTGTVPTLGPGQKVTVTYCNGEQARITEPVKGFGRAPAAVYVHGGSWVSGDYDTGGFIINKIGPTLAAFGFVVVSVDYRLGPGKPWPAQIEDVKCAIRYLRANARALDVNPNEIGAWGQSAGGHLVSLLGTAGPNVGWDGGAYSNESSKVQAVVDMAGPADLLTMGDQGVSGVVQDSFISLLGNVSPAKLGGELRAASPVTYIAAGDPPFLIIAADNDEIVYLQQSQELDFDLAAAGVPQKLLVVNGAGHEFDQAGASLNEQQITNNVLSFFVSQLHPRT
ncbi:MAG TPA: alpha/beta hydrolase [Acidimicrobiales bacterium]|nr:alpha/beta hydrolase [Acidimicrobiales bacterium]